MVWLQFGGLFHMMDCDYDTERGVRYFEIGI